VRALILGLVQQVMNHPVVMTHRPEGLEMAGHAPDHPGHASHGLQEDAPVKPLILCHLLLIEAGPQIEEGSKASHGPKGQLIPQILSFHMRLSELSDCLQVIDRVLLPVIFGVHQQSVLRCR